MIVYKGLSESFILLHIVLINQTVFEFVLCM